MCTLISKFAIITPKNQVVKIRKTEADPDSDAGENHTCSRLQNFNSTCLLHVIHPQLFKRNKYYCIYVYVEIYTILPAADRVPTGRRKGAVESNDLW